MLKEVYDISGQHEVIAENLTCSIIKETAQMITELKHERKRVRHFLNIRTYRFLLWRWHIHLITLLQATTIKLN